MMNNFKTSLWIYNARRQTYDFNIAGCRLDHRALKRHSFAPPITMETKKRTLALLKSAHNSLRLSSWASHIGFVILIERYLYNYWKVHFFRQTGRLRRSAWPSVATRWPALCLVSQTSPSSPPSDTVSDRRVGGGAGLRDYALPERTCIYYVHHY